MQTVRRAVCAQLGGSAAAAVADDDSAGIGVAAQRLVRGGGTRHVVTNCRQLDDMLGGGIAVGDVTELVGLPGTGRTQLALQLCCNVQVPKVFGGLDGDAVFIDTEGALHTERLRAMAEAHVGHIQRIAERRGLSGDFEALTSDDVLERIHVFSADDLSELLGIVHHLPSVLRRKTSVRLVVIDSVAVHFRHDVGDTAHRSRVLTALGQSLGRVAHEQRLAVVLTNHLTIRVEPTGDGGSGAGGDFDARTRLTPALGQTWAHVARDRLLLSHESDGTRHVTISKSLVAGQTRVPFRITADGVRGEAGADSGAKRARRG